ncbi:hypothetical protein BOTBODRAFT_188026 [Botryobasidium botryosum FD-172 SS1]|uniref:Uncharacterized protein n=1 Tax=Botryobasidium botryosum (strain FD-172 SS1) TaxID=930990 RepID=A0A067MR84_BOTB1|nr:hypothetical protein BOTBODRAFT_188026 [Botryobasidium botryosum FD-172 SS1]
MPGKRMAKLRSGIATPGSASSSRQSSTATRGNATVNGKAPPNADNSMSAKTAQTMLTNYFGPRPFPLPPPASSAIRTPPPTEPNKAGTKRKQPIVISDDDVVVKKERLESPIPSSAGTSARGKAKTTTAKPARRDSFRQKFSPSSSELSSLPPSPVRRKPLAERTNPHQFATPAVKEKGKQKESIIVASSSSPGELTPSEPSSPPLAPKSVRRAAKPLRIADSDEELGSDAQVTPTRPPSFEHPRAIAGSRSPTTISMSQLRVRGSSIDSILQMPPPAVRPSAHPLQPDHSRLDDTTTPEKLPVEGAAAVAAVTLSRRHQMGLDPPGKDKLFPLDPSCLRQESIVPESPSPGSNRVYHTESGHSFVPTSQSQDLDLSFPLNTTQGPAVNSSDSNPLSNSIVPDSQMEGELDWDYIHQMGGNDHRLGSLVPSSQTQLLSPTPPRRPLAASPRSVRTVGALGGGFSTPRRARGNAFGTGGASPLLRSIHSPRSSRRKANRDEGLPSGEAQVPLPSVLRLIAEDIDPDVTLVGASAKKVSPPTPAAPTGSSTRPPIPHSPLSSPISKSMEVVSPDMGTAGKSETQYETIASEWRPSPVRARVFDAEESLESADSQQMLDDIAPLRFMPPISPIRPATLSAGDKGKGVPQRQWQRVESTGARDPGSSQTEYESIPPTWKYQGEGERAQPSMPMSSQTEYETLPPSLDPQNFALNNNHNFGGGPRSSRLSRFGTEDGDITVVNPTLPKKPKQGKEGLGDYDYDEFDGEEDKYDFSQFRSQFDDDSQSQDVLIGKGSAGSPLQAGRSDATSGPVPESLIDLMQDSSQSQPRSEQDSQPLSVVPDSEGVGEGEGEPSGLTESGVGSGGTSNGAEGSQLFPAEMRAFFHDMEARRDSLEDMLRREEEESREMIVDSQ